MADEADITAERDEHEYALRLAATKKAVGPEPTGECFWCEAPVGVGLRFCDSDCADDFAKHSRLHGGQFVKPFWGRT